MCHIKNYIFNAFYNLHYLKFIILLGVILDKYIVISVYPISFPN